MEFFKSRYFYIGVVLTLVTIGAVRMGISFQYHRANSFWGIFSTLYGFFCLYKIGAIFWRPLGFLLPVLVLFMLPFFGFLEYRGKTIKRWANVKGVNVEYYQATLGFTDAVAGFDIYETISFCPFLEKYKWSAKGMDIGELNGQSGNIEFEGLGETGLRVRFPLIDSMETKTLQPMYLGYSRYF